ncbi:MAG: hypothetical protein C0498_11450 [Anaerolinea sp.]|nr:hypothetical protein [Anaerolinea sp.]
MATGDGRVVGVTDAIGGTGGAEIVASGATLGAGEHAETTSASPRSAARRRGRPDSVICDSAAYSAADSVPLAVP